MTETPGPGRELDILVAEKALGWFWIRYAGLPAETCDGSIEAFLCSPEEWEKFDHGKDGDRSRYMKDDGKYPKEQDPSYGRLPRFSTDRTDALTVLDHFWKAGGDTGLGMDGHTGFRAQVGQHEAQGDSPAHAICLAALMAAAAVPKGSV